MVERNRTITVVASELLGRAGTGGAGTADSLLAVALARHGHQVELLVASGRDIGALNSHWTEVYESSGVRVRVLEPMPGVRPRFLAPPFEVMQALRERPPEVVIVNDWRGLGYAALRMRQVQRALVDTAFVMHCHGPGRVLSAFAQKVPDTIDRFGEDVIERASMGLADAVVSPSAWLLSWMRDHRWPVPESAKVIQYLRESTALGTPPPAPAERAPIRRLAFFGQLREGKGIRVFLAGMNKLQPELLRDVEVVFLGSENRRWPSDEIRRGLPENVRTHARIETELPREAALAELRHPGTLAVMPSLLDNSPNTVAECIENGVPFVAAATGGIPELVADGDRARVLCEPTAEDLAAALTRALDGATFEPARAARDPQASLDEWLDVVATVEPQRSSRPEATETDWTLFADDNVNVDDDLTDVLVAAQAASGADVVTFAVRSADDPEAVQLFVGDAGALGLAQNQYGVAGLVRASLVEKGASAWLLFARLALAGARIVSIPEPLGTLRGRPGSVTDVPGDGLAVLETFEQSGAELRDLPQFAATVAAALARTTAEVREPAPRSSLVGRVERRIRRA